MSKSLEPAQPEKLTLFEWLQERKANALALAKGKLYDPGWLEDADYFARAIEALRALACESLVSFDEAVAQWEGRDEWMFADTGAMRRYFYGAGRAVATSSADSILRQADEALATAESEMRDWSEDHPSRVEISKARAAIASEVRGDE